MADHLPGCSCCGAPLDPVDLAIRSAWPDAMLALTPEEREATWGTDSLRRAPGIGGFVRCMMPVQLSGGGSVEYSVWLKVDDDQLQEAARVWTLPEYTGLALHGTIANDVKPWQGMLGEPASAEVRDPGTIPWLVAPPGGLMQRILHDSWDRDDVLSRIAHALPVTINERITTTWSIERTAGMAPHFTDDALRFAGPGRTVHLFPYTDVGFPPAEAVQHLSAAPPDNLEGDLAEQDGDLHRRAFWFRSSRGPYNLHGFVAVPGHALHVVAVYDDAADLEWAQRVWRSVHADSGSAGAAC